jgi:cytochrome c553
MTRGFLRLAGAALGVVLASGAGAQAFDLEAEVAHCNSCHGEAGMPVEADYPILWGQQYYYIFTQLRDYGAGRRQHEIMTDIAAVFDRDQAKALAEHFAAQPWPAIQVTTEEGDMALASAAVTGGQCSACHGKWQGDSRIPRLAGQQPAYLDRTMLDFKHERRLNAPDKISTMQQLDDATIAALSRYLGAL